MSKLADVMTVEQASRKLKEAGCGMRRAPLKKFIRDHGLAIEWPSGGIRVKFSELESRLLAQRVTAKSRQASQRARAIAAGLDPAVKC